MRIHVLIIDDIRGSYKRKDGQEVDQRILHCVDQDPESRLLAMVQVSISPEDAKAGAANLRGATANLSISRIVQYEASKSLGFTGSILNVQPFTK